MRVIVTGPREWRGEKCFNALYGVMTGIRDEYNVPDDETITLVEGEARGFDKMARAIALDLGWEIDPHPVLTWYPGDVFNPEAGHQRNQEMVDTGGDIALAGQMGCTKKEHLGQDFHITHGTADCMERLEDAGIPIVKVYDDGEG